MKLIKIFFIIMIISNLLYSQNCEQKDKLRQKCNGEKGNCVQTIDSIKYDLSSTEKDGLIYMRLEEKLALDVYLTLGKTYTQKMFVNIPQSEQRHMDAVKVLIDRYEIPDPVINYEIGFFSNSEFQKHYTDLVKKGQTSFKDAMLIGKEIEELDIKDLNERLEQTDNPDITSVYENLKHGSENHLKAFVKHLD